MKWSFEALLPEYSRRWSQMIMDDQVRSAAVAKAQQIANMIKRYREVEAKTGVPAAVVAVIHMRESNNDFKTYLGNGEPLDRVTRLVPAGRGPFQSWVAGAIDALEMRGMHKIQGWSIERALFELEAYNGWGYRNHHCASAYVWAGSNQYQGGKYVADGVFDSHVRDRQLGTAIVLRLLFDLDGTLALKRANIDAKASPLVQGDVSPSPVQMPKSTPKSQPGTNLDEKIPPKKLPGTPIAAGGAVAAAGAATGDWRWALGLALVGVGIAVAFHIFKHRRKP